MTEWASLDAGADAITQVLGRLFSLRPRNDAEMSAALDYNARLVTRLRVEGMWP